MKAFWRRKRFALVLIVIDAAAFSALWMLTYYIRSRIPDLIGLAPELNPFQNYLAALPVYLVFWVAIAWSNALYNFSGRVGRFNILRRSVKAGAMILVTSAGLSFFFKEMDLGRSVIIIFSIFAFLYLNNRSLAIRILKQRAIEAGIGRKRVLIVGVNDTSERVLRRLNRDPERAFEVVGFVREQVADERSVTTLEADGGKILGDESALAEILALHSIDEVFLALPRSERSHIMNLVTRCELVGVDVKIVSNIFEVITTEVVIDEIDEFPVIHLPHSHLSAPEQFLKRLIDIVGALILLIAGALPALIIAILIKRDSPGPALFRQDRVGHKGRVFSMWKFRTMYINTPKYEVAPDDPEDERITRIGRRLRKLSVDELPQILNVLSGEMSLVGPRPEMPFIVDQYEEWQKRRLEVKPGLTGLWQVMGRKNLPLHLNIEYDFYYIKNQSILLDLIILLRTIPAVIFGKGAY